MTQQKDRPHYPAHHEPVEEGAPIRDEGAPSAFYSAAGTHEGSSSMDGYDRALNEAKPVVGADEAALHGHNHASEASNPVAGAEEAVLHGPQSSVKEAQIKGKTAEQGKEGGMTVAGGKITPALETKGRGQRSTAHDSDHIIGE